MCVVQCKEMRCTHNEQQCKVNDKQSKAKHINEMQQTVLGEQSRAKQSSLSIGAIIVT